MIEEKRNYNERHPELEVGEMFLTHCRSEDYIEIGWISKRMGVVAYTPRGVPLPKYRPVFVLRSEYEEGKKNE
ncbi:MAG: hypothetical protein IMF19_05105 [Proteobacteria bacterium]|nr:hypothetical protein [Pseudomonadota bacterium]